jgi:hypothetical protein
MYIFVYLAAYLILAFPPLSYKYPSSPFVLHAMITSLLLTLSFQLYLAESTSYETPQNVAFSNLLSLHSPWFKAPCS